MRIALVCVKVTNVGLCLDRVDVVKEVDVGERYRPGVQERDVEHPPQVLFRERNLLGDLEPSVRG